MDHEPSIYCECKECLIIYQSYHNWRKLKQLETDIKNKAIARKAGSAAKAGTKLVTHALGIGGIAGALINYGAGTAVKTATESALQNQNNTFEQRKQLYRQKMVKSKQKSVQSYPHFEPLLDEKEMTQYKDNIASTLGLNEKLHKFDNDVVIMSMSNVIFAGWLEKKSDNFGQWRNRFIFVHRTLNYILVETFKSLKINSFDDLNKLISAKHSSILNHRTSKIKIDKSPLAAAIISTVKYDKNSDSYCLIVKWRINSTDLVLRCKSNSAMKFWRNVFEEIVIVNKYKKGNLKLYVEFSKLNKNKNNHLLWWILARQCAMNDLYDKCIEHYEYAHLLCTKEAELMIFYIEDLRNYFGERTNDKQLELYEKMERLYGYKFIDYENYCLLLYKMKQYKKLKSILINEEIINNGNIGIYEQILYWNEIYENLKSDNKVKNVYMKYTENIQKKLSDIEVDINSLSTHKLNNYAKMFINCGDYNTAHDYLSLSVCKKPDDFETINLMNKNNKFLREMDHEEKEEIRELKLSIEKLQLSVESLNKENELLKNNVQILNEIVPKLQKLLEKSS
eukprot:284176_1